MTNQGAVQQLTSFLPFASIYSVVAGTLYLWGYWSAFDINILQYIGLVDLAKSAAFPLISAVAGISIGAMLGQWASGDRLPAGGGADTPIGRFLQRNSKRLLALYVGTTLALLFVDHDGKWLVIPLLACPTFIFALHDAGALREVIPSQGMRNTVIAVLTVIICSAFGHGRIRAGEVIWGRSYFLVDQASIRRVDGVRITATGELRYLGHAGDYVFLYATDSSIQILRADAVPAMVLQRRALSAIPWWPK
jgi:hypothetical protein